MSQGDINSHDYWNGRFDTDWESNKGQEQSRFFARVALENLPAWLRSTANQNNWKVCDWGCAQGDGTDVLAGYFAREQVVGIDFAESAVKTAREHYPTIRFDAQDWLASDTVSEKFDLVFSSNTLEHFTDPFNVLSKLFQRTGHCVVLALPYRELDRISEHFFTFAPENIPLFAHSDWLLVHSRAVDCRGMNPTYWYGDQIILVYVNRHWAEANRLVLGDVYVNADIVNVDIAQLARVEQAKKHEALLEHHSRLSNEVVELKKLLNNFGLLLDAQLQQQAIVLEEQRKLDAANKDLALALASMQNSSSWRLTAPIRALGRAARKVLRVKD
ncbi:class I SAM-dependent methyltransferase [Achromobacter sp. NCFB-sbj8-Ac1-l]|uniref:class I SAM-dependent methyltransferase n=1 Tax=unclassified Achromobacter TaxID=2626865 RepID=UPI004046D482